MDDWRALNRTRTLFDDFVSVHFEKSNGYDEKSLIYVIDITGMDLLSLGKMRGGKFNSEKLEKMR